MRMSVRPDGEAADRLALLGRRAEAAHLLDRERVVAQALGERPVVLLREDRGGHEHHHLLAGVGGLEGGAQRDLRLAVADVSTDETVHRALGFHVGLDELDRLPLVGRLGVRERGLELAQPVRVGLEGVPAPALALRVEVQQLAGELLRGPAGARLHRLPARAAELGEGRRVAVGADVAGDLRQLVRRHEDLVGALELQVQVVARDPGDGLGVEAREAPDPVVLVHDVVARAQVGERAQQPAAAARRTDRRAPAVDQAVLGDRGQLEPGRDEAVPQGRLLEDEAGLVIGLPAGLDALEVVGGALAPAPVGPGDQRRVTGAHELLELRLGLVERAGGEFGGLGAELERLRARDRGQAGRAARVELGEDAVGLDVEAVRVGVVEGGADVVPVVAQRRLDVLLGGQDQRRLRGQQLEQVAEVVDGQQLGDVGPRVRLLERRDLGQLAVLGGELRRGRDLDAVGIAERPLREGREPAQGLDLVVEQVDADRALLRRRIDVQQAAADRELPAVLDLVDALVAGRDEIRRRLVEVEQLAGPQREAVRPQRGVGDLLAQRDGAHHDYGGFGSRTALEDRVERRDPEADQVGGRAQMRLVGDAAARVEADGPGAQPGAQVGGEVARRAVVAGDHDGGPPRVALGQRRDHVRPQRLRHERARVRRRQRFGVGVQIELGEERSEAHGARRTTARGGAARSASESRTGSDPLSRRDSRGLTP